MQSIEEEEKISALDKFIMALRLPDSTRTFPTKLKFFLDDFLKLPGSSLEEKAEVFVQKANENGVSWVLHRVLGFRKHYEQLIYAKKIESSTLYTYLNVIKSFCDKNDDVMPTLPASKWKMIKAGLPKRRSVADVRAPDLDEIRKLLNYNDPRIKALVLTLYRLGFGLALGRLRSMALGSICVGEMLSAYPKIKASQFNVQK